MASLDENDRGFTYTLSLLLLGPLGRDDPRRGSLVVLLVCCSMNINCAGEQFSPQRTEQRNRSRWSWYQRSVPRNLLSDVISLSAEMFLPCIPPSSLYYTHFTIQGPFIISSHSFVVLSLPAIPGLQQILSFPNTSFPL